jgi:hypothetical protein
VEYSGIILSKAELSQNGGKVFCNLGRGDGSYTLGLSRTCGGNGLSLGVIGNGSTSEHEAIAVDHVFEGSGCFTVLYDDGSGLK